MFQTGAKKAWIFWLVSIPCLLLGLANIYGSARHFIDLARFNARASAAADNQQYLTEYNMRRSGALITIVGTAYLFDGHRERWNAHQFGWIQLKDSDKTVALAGTSLPLCNGDDIAASGEFRFSDSGGVLVVSDSRNVAATFHYYLPRFDAAILAFDPAWCGFPGDPINGSAAASTIQQ